MSSTTVRNPKPEDVFSSVGAFSAKQSTRANDASMKSTPTEEPTVRRYPPTGVNTPQKSRREQHDGSQPKTRGRVLLCWRVFDQAIHACQRCIHEVYANRGAHHPSLFRQLAHREISSVSSTCKFMGVGQSLKGQTLKSKQLPRKLHAMMFCDLCYYHKH